MLADTLLRSPLPIVNDSKQTNFEIFRIDIDNNIGNLRVTSETMKDIKAAKASDPTLCSLNRVIITGWPSGKLELHQGVHPYWNFREELTFQDGVFYKGTQVRIPSAKRNFFLPKAHAARFGAESNVRLCKDTEFWSGMKSDIREACRSCRKCAQFQVENAKEPMKSQPIPEYPWQFVSQGLVTLK